MLNQIKPYIHIILTEKEWSWSVVALAALIVGLILRSYVLRPILRRIKDLEKADYTEVKKQYLARSLWGWIFFILAIIFAVGLWKTPVSFPLSRPETLIVMGLMASFFLSLLFHLLAIGTATAIVFGQHKELFRS
ncbi:MAG: hypothetical protein EXS63_01695 [Candidatus Omnitrophica bacterium]|nr:hypothetical protein [Candidatus Omnitrophota bacterium]